MSVLSDPAAYADGYPYHDAPDGLTEAEREEAVSRAHEYAKTIRRADTPTRRGTTNRNERGNVEDRRRRREWLVETFRADIDVRPITESMPSPLEAVALGDGIPACRCYRCGRLLTVDTVSPDRIVPGCEGGRYTRDNIRPACETCQSITGGHLGAARKRAKS